MWKVLKVNVFVVRKNSSNEVEKRSSKSLVSGDATSDAHTNGRLGERRGAID